MNLTMTTKRASRDKSVTLGAVAGLLLLNASGCGATDGGQSGTDESEVERVTPGSPDDSVVPEESEAPLDTSESPEISSDAPALGEPPLAAGASCSGRPYDENGSLLVMAAEENDYAFSNRISLDSASVAADPAGLTFGWSGLTSDFLGKDVGAGDIDTVALVLWNLGERDLERKLNADTLAPTDAVAMVTLDTNDVETSGAFYDFTLSGSPVESDVLARYLDPVRYPPANHTYTLIAMTGTTVGQGTRMIQSFSLDDASTSTHVEIGSTSTRLDYVADLRSLQRTVLPEGTTGITFDWSEIETNALGKPFLEDDITEVLVARYSQSSERLEQQFLDLESIHEGLWRGNVESGASLSLTELTDESGAPFPGFDSQSTWVVALICGNCSNPAPWYMTVIETCSEQ